MMGIGYLMVVGMVGEWIGVGLVVVGGEWDQKFDSFDHFGPYSRHFDPDSGLVMFDFVDLVFCQYHQS